MKNKCLPILMALMLLFVYALSHSAHATGAFRSSGGYVPKAADAAVKQLHKQLVKQFGKDAPFDQLRIAFTIPANVDNLQKTNGLARQMSEELARGLKQHGYAVLEIRKGNEIVMTPEVGELFLTRKRDKLSQQSVMAELLMAGTYTIAEKGIRFNIRLLHTDSTEVIAMATTTVPMYDEIIPLLVENKAEAVQLPLGPSVGTKLSPPASSIPLTE